MDTSAFIAGFDPFSVENEVYSVPLVKEELIPDSMSWIRFHAAMENGKLKVKSPSEKFIEKVQCSSKSVGDFRFLSDADVQILALALQLKSAGKTPVVATDDYSMQNVANKLGLEFASLLTFGIKFRFNWILYCPACHRKYPAEYKKKRCEVCETQLKRKPLERKRIKK